MAKYLFVYHGGGMPESEQEQARVMAAWGAWFGALADSVVDGGNPTGASKTVSKGSTRDGGGANPASGYSVIEATSLDDAVEKAKGCPIVSYGGNVEVCETIEVSL